LDGIERVDFDGMAPRDVAGAVRNLSTAAGIDQDKANALRARPTEIVAYRHAIDVLHRLKQISPALVIDGSAEDDGPGGSDPEASGC
jgi:hypothetical protein